MRLLNIEYDRTVDAAYIYLDVPEPGGAKKTYACDPLEVAGMINLDFDAAGRLIGIEVLGASSKLSPDILRLAIAQRRFDLTKPWDLFAKLFRRKTRPS